MLMRIFALGIATVAFGSLALVDAASSTAFAGQPALPVEPSQSIDTGRPIGPELCAQQLSFQAFQSACNNPTANGWQIRPPQINVTCTKRELVWIPTRTNLEMRLPTLVDIDVSLGGKKKCVDDRISYQSESVEQAICFQFEQVERTYSRTIQASCDDLAKYTDAVELCDMALKGSPTWALVGQEKTNLTMNSCGGPTVDSSISVEPKTDQSDLLGAQPQPKLGQGEPLGPQPKLGQGEPLFGAQDSQL